MTGNDTTPDGRPSTTLRAKNQRSSARLAIWCVVLMLAVSSLLIVACGGDGDDEDGEQAPTATIAAVATPTVEIASTPTAMPEPTSTATSEPTAAEMADTSLSIEPSSGPYGTSFDYQFSGLTPRAEYVVVTIFPDGTEDRQNLMADSSGTYLVAAEAGPGRAIGDQFAGWFSELPEPAGEYVVELRAADGETVLAEATFTVSEPTSAVETETPGSTEEGPSIRVSPKSGSRDELFLFITSGLTADQVYELVIRDPDGEESVEEAVFDENSMELVAVSGPYEGEALSIWGVEPGDPLGEYTVELRDVDTGDVLTSATFVVE